MIEQGFKDSDRFGRQILILMWGIAALGFVAAAVYALVSREQRLAGPHDLGSVSDHWIAEHRAHQAADQSR